MVLIKSKVSFEIREGEIVGIAGVEGNGQTELIEVLAGLRKADKGSYVVNGVSMLNKSPKYLRSVRTFSYTWR